MSDKKNNVIVFGNGFDIALGLPTQYRDFVNSDFWPLKEASPLGSNVENLHNYFYRFTKDNQDILGRVRWIDIEELLLKYATSRITSFKPSIEESIVNDDIDTYENIKKQFVLYILDKVCLASSSMRRPPEYVDTVFKAIVANGTFSQLYSFNYTATSSLLDLFWGYDKSVTHLHGVVSTDRDKIILGINDKDSVPDQYKFFQKSRDEHYRFHDLNDALVLADDIIFYGLSFGPADFVYFKSFFSETVRNYRAGNSSKKRIDIFTNDESARQYIISSLEQIGITMSDLYASIRFTSHKAESGLSDENLVSFFSHLRQTAYKERSVIEQYGGLYNRPPRIGKGHW